MMGPVDRGGAAMKVLYFAWLRSRVGTGAEDVTPPAGVTTVGGPLAWPGAARRGRGAGAVGGVACFVGLVRDMAGTAPIGAMTLEHYPGMTEKKLAEIEAEANRRWILAASLIVHRYGRLQPGGRIGLGATAAAH